jgi:hypothetical protein
MYHECHEIALPPHPITIPWRSNDGTSCRAAQMVLEQDFNIEIWDAGTLSNNGFEVLFSQMAR